MHGKEKNKSEFKIKKLVYIEVNENHQKMILGIKPSIRIFIILLTSLNCWNAWAEIAITSMQTKLNSPSVKTGLIYRCLKENGEVKVTKIVVKIDSELGDGEGRAKQTFPYPVIFCVANFEFKGPIVKFDAHDISFEGWKQIGKSKYQYVKKNLALTKSVNDHSDEFPFEWSISDGKNKSKLGSVEYVYSDSAGSYVKIEPQIVWVGDLDGDQKPDFYIRLNTQSSQFSEYLGLSSKAGPGQVFKVVATQNYDAGVD